MKDYELIDSAKFNKLNTNRYSGILQSFHYKGSFYNNVIHCYPAFIKKAMNENHSIVIHESGTLNFLSTN